MSDHSSPHGKLKSDPEEPLGKLRFYSPARDCANPFVPDDSLEHLLVDCFEGWARHWYRQAPTANGVFYLFDPQGELLASSPRQYGPVGQGEEAALEEVRQAAVDCAFKRQAVRNRDAFTLAGMLPIVDESNRLIAVFGLQDQLATPADLNTRLEAAGIAFMTVVELTGWKDWCREWPMDQVPPSPQRELLFEAAHSLQAMTDVESVLTELVAKINAVLPDASLELLLSQDYPNVSLPVQLLNFSPQQDNLPIRSFREGTALSGGQPNGSQYAAPLLGKQGVYGVVHLDKRDRPFTKAERETIRTITEFAGTAFENAKLYEQSNLLISELQLINEITKRLNQSLKLNEIFSFVLTELIDIFCAEFCCVLQLDKHTNKLVVQASNLPAMFNEHFELDYGFSGVIHATKEPMIISDYWKNPKVKSKLMEQTGSRSLIASPIVVDGEGEGVILVTHRFANFFSYENYKLLQVLSDHIGLAIANASLHAEVRRMVITDRLTGLFARHYLDEQVSQMQKRDYCGSLIVVDIDNFKGVNDTFGHQIGDKILVHVSHIIRICIRESDIAARWGGEELAIYLPQVAIDQAVRIAERIRNRVHHETDPHVTVSCGVADWNWQDERISVEALFYKSDMALYKAKHNGKNQIKIG